MQTAKSPINLYREFFVRLITPYHIHCVAVADFVSVEKRPFRSEIGEVKGLVKHLEMLHFTRLLSAEIRLFLPLLMYE